MAIKTQGTEINRTVTNFFQPADVGSFNTAFHSIVIRGDANRRIYITGFSFTWRVGAVGDVNISSNLEFLCAENYQVTANSGIAIFPEVNSYLKFAYADNAQFFQNILREQFQSPFKLVPGILYSFIGLYQSGGGAIVADATSRLTVFGYEESDFQKKQYFGEPR